MVTLPYLSLVTAYESIKSISLWYHPVDTFSQTSAQAKKSFQLLEWKQLGEIKLQHYLEWAQSKLYQARVLQLISVKIVWVNLLAGEQ